MSTTCKDCKFFNDNGTGNGLGQCFAMPPIVIRVADGQQGMPDNIEWSARPSVHEDDRACSMHSKANA